MTSETNIPENFDDLVLYLLHNSIVIDEAQLINRQQERANFMKSILVRNIQVIRDSIDIVKATTNEEITRSRMALINKRYKEIVLDQKRFIKLETFAEITSVVKSIERLSEAL